MYMKRVSKQNEDVWDIHPADVSKHTPYTFQLGTHHRYQQSLLLYGFRSPFNIPSRSKQTIELMAQNVAPMSLHLALDIAASMEWGE